MSSLIKNVKFGAAGALMFAAAALIAACGGTGQAEQLDYPENWPAEFAQQVHDEFDGIFNGVAFTDPLPPNEDTREQLRITHAMFDCFPQDSCFVLRRHGFSIKVADVVNEHGEVIHEIRSIDNDPDDDVLRLFRDGGYAIMDEITPFDKLVWSHTTLYIDVLVHHYQLGSASPLCDIARSKGNNIERILDFCGGRPSYPVSWPAEFAQQVHENFEGIFEGVFLGRMWLVQNPNGNYSIDERTPLPPNEATLDELRSVYDRFVCCFPRNIGDVDTPDTITQIALVMNAQDEWAFIRGAPLPDDDALKYFVRGGAPVSDVSSIDGTNSVPEFDEDIIPFAEIYWIQASLYVNVLMHHYTLGGDSPLCDIARREGRIEPIKNFCSQS